MDEQEAETPYPEQMGAPMRAEMGAVELKSSDEVQERLSNREGTALYFVNSVCGCAAGSA